MCAERRRRAARGQALVEAQVAALALLPAVAVVVLLGKAFAAQHATQAAARQLAFECSARPQSCAPALADGVADELRLRHFGVAAHAPRSGERPASASVDAEALEPLLFDRGGRPMLSRWGDVAAGAASQRFDAVSALAAGQGGRVVAGATRLVEAIAGPSRFGLALDGGLLVARVEASLSPGASRGGSASGRATLAPDAWPLVFRGRTAVLTDAWAAAAVDGTHPASLRARVEAGQRLPAFGLPVNVAESAIDAGYAGTRALLAVLASAPIPLEPAARAFRYHEVPVDRLPSDRWAP